MHGLNILKPFQNLSNWYSMVKMQKITKTGQEQINNLM